MPLSKGLVKLIQSMWCLADNHFSDHVIGENEAFVPLVKTSFSLKMSTVFLFLHENIAQRLSRLTPCLSKMQMKSQISLLIHTG